MTTAIAPSQIEITELMERAIQLAIDEDLGVESKLDMTTAATVPPDITATAELRLKQAAVVAGLAVFERVMIRFSDDMSFEPLVEDGAFVADAPQAVLRVTGPAAAILTAERLSLNLLQRMSGVATLTRRFVRKARPAGIKILDTRKTTPCLREFERYAVRLAGGDNHRSGLYDRVLIKDNHIKICGSIGKAIEKARSTYPDAHLEVEARTLEEVREAIGLEPETILLDNMTPALVSEAVGIIGGRSLVEVSGGINLDNLEGYLLEGVDAISVGALTHSHRAVDFSLEMLDI